MSGRLATTAEKITMSTNNDNDNDNDTTEAFDSAVEQLSTEAQEAVHEIEGVIESAENAAQETQDVAEPVVNALSELAAGDRVGAVNAAMLLFSDETSKEIAEARAACLAFLNEAESAADETQDVIDVVSDIAATVADALDASGLADRLKNLF